MMMYEDDGANVSSTSLLLTTGGAGAAGLNNNPNYLESSNGSNWTNWTGESEDYLKSSPAVQVHIYILYAVIFTVGLVGNVLVVFVVAQNKAMQTVTNCYIANLALSDILLCVLAVPFTPLYFFLKEWIFGKILCHLVAYSQGTSVYVSTLTLTSIAIDRFFVILYPFRPRMKMTTCWITICIIWLVALCATLPYGIFVDIRIISNVTYCEESWTSDYDRQIYGAVTSVMQFVVPFVIMAFAYTKVSLKLADRSREKAKIRLRSCRGEELDRERKRRTNRMLIAMVTIFGASWMPLNLINLLNDLYAEYGMAWWKYYNLCFFLAHTIAMSSTCYNVFLYAWLNDNFRKELKRILPCFPAPAASSSTGGVVGAASVMNPVPGSMPIDAAVSAANQKRSVNGDQQRDATRSNPMNQSPQSDSEGDAECATSCVQILLPGETEDGELMNHDDDDYQPTFETAANATSPVTSADGKATTNNVERNQWQQQQQQPSVVIELTPMTYSPVTSDTCPQCSSSAAKTSFMTFDELADASALIITNSPAAAANNPSAAAVTNC
ncbi:prolactin-releasing peptide receptor-like isoform X1 [Daphnia pulex]|uniref:prolactin-releasing peptide receptor-like isoform X1 n=1 Tax=Daphnia pulex TaxID=6669 RepID=UPI001EDD50E5|nr:prolactin-releasing peptide receptor-like isoform X1 [Daphnia pulex]XP_046438497.1 prolactin-releasing peptide receptor-like isoform X1 [Daphnia pulex]